MVGASEYMPTDPPEIQPLNAMKATNMKATNPKNGLTRHLFLLAATTLLAAGPAAQAATLVEYTFATNTSPTTTGTNVASQNYSVPGSFSGGTIAHTTGSGGNVYYTRNATGAPTSQAEALTNTFYSSFTLSADSGFALDLDQLSFQYGGTTPSDRSFTANFFLRSSVDSFATDLGSFSLAIPLNTSAPLYASGAVDLTGAAFQGITGNVTFRIYSFGTLDNPQFSTASRARIDTVSLTGVVIPEPTTWALLAGALTVTVILRRRRQA